MSKKKKVRIPDREVYKRRIENFLKNPPSTKIDGPASIELDAHWAKYACVLVSGYMEKSVMELLLSYAILKSENRVSFYIEKTWPKSKNMNSTNVIALVGNFDAGWGIEISNWLGNGDQSNKSIIDGIITTRNNIAHGSESNTNGVTINSVKSQFETAKGLITKLEDLIC